LPAKEMCTWASAHGIHSLVDGAQSLSVFDIKVNDLGCDFFTSNGHKWLSGPKGTGIFYAAEKSLSSLSPAHVGAGSCEIANVETGETQLWNTARRFEFGTRATTLYAGLGYSLEWLNTLGFSNIEHYIAQLSKRLKDEILDRSYLKLLTPIDFDQSSGLTTFVTDNWNAGKLSQELWKKGRIRVRVIPHFNAIRLSTAHFNNSQDIDRLMMVLDTIINNE
ncbi:MAG: aminotransferase class V-fold PLP-dependent enzyme, partial [Anaerolineae bacterium]|nr:aminotransferase class V-fold PLP-dependent enzyme [Anaerolineae bacterium]